MADRRQGDSISRDVSGTGIADLTGFTGKWAIFTAIGGTSIKNGTLAMSVDKTKLECRVPPYDGADVLPVGNVYLEIQIENTSLAFRETLPQEKIKILPQGILP